MIVAYLIWLKHYIFRVHTHFKVLTDSLLDELHFLMENAHQINHLGDSVMK
jgi:hypothetical protein